VAVYVATTEGPVQVERIVAEPGIVQSTARVSGTTKLALFGQGYDDFVKRGSGIIAREIAPGPFRMNLSAPIHDGESWQLGVFVAHALARDGRLAGAEDTFSRAVWATGSVDFDLGIGPVDEVEAKVETSRRLFDTVPVLALVPSETLPPQDLPPGVSWMPIKSARQACLELAIALSQATPVQRPVLHNRLRRWAFALVGLMLATAAVSFHAARSDERFADEVSIARGAVRVRLFERRPMAEQNCAAVHLGSAQANLVPLKRGRSGTFEGGASEGLCGLRVGVTATEPGHRLALTLVATRGRVVDSFGRPRGLDGEIPLVGEGVWDLNFPVHADGRREVDLVVSLAPPQGSAEAREASDGGRVVVHYRSAEPSPRPLRVNPGISTH
jgi:hypothetical protein